jgi:hypothetical protein
MDQKSLHDRLLPAARNDVFVAIQAAMLAVTNGDPAATKQCLEIALSELKSWQTARTVPPVR